MNFNYTSTSPYYGSYSPRIILDHSVKIISIPLRARFYIGKYFFFNGGILTDIDISEKTIYNNKKLSGMGAGAGIGLQYNFTKNIAVFINPSLDFRNLVPFTTGKHYDRLVAANIAVGLTLALNK